MSVDPDLYLESFERDDSDDWSLSSVEVGNRSRNKRVRHIDYPANGRVSTRSDSSHSGRSAKPKTCKRRRKDFRESTSHLHFGESGYSGIIDPIEVGTNNCDKTDKQSHDGVAKAYLEIELEKFVDAEWECLPEWDWQAEFQLFRAGMMAMSLDNFCPQGDTHGNDEDLVDDPWFLPQLESHENHTSIETEDLGELEPKTRQIEDDEIICYGMIYQVRVKLIDRALPLLQQLLINEPVTNTSETSNIVLFDIKRPDDAPHYFIHALKTGVEEVGAKDYLAVLNSKSSEAMAAVAALCSFEAYSYFTEFAKAGRQSSSINDEGFFFTNVILYGQFRNRHQVGSMLNSRKIFLQDPDCSNPSHAYKNPHILDLDEIYPQLAGIRGPQVVSDLRFEELFYDGTTPANIVPISLQRRMASVLDNLSQSQHFRRVEADSRVRTPLKPYQEEALDFISQVEFGGSDGSNSLWEKSYHPIDGSLQVHQNGGFRYFLLTKSSYTHLITGCTSAAKPMEACGGILADDMGLGKTLTMLCTIIRTLELANLFSQVRDVRDVNESLSRAHRRIPARATLVVVPSPLILRVWKLEIEKHCPDLFNVEFYHGQGRKGKSFISALANSDLVLSTYHTIAYEVRDSTSPLWEIEWFRIILDEAHVIRRRTTTLFKAIKKLKGKYRWCLTGTPIQNAPEDLAALLSFLEISPMDDIRRFRTHIGTPLNNNSAEGFENLRILLSRVCLRRTIDIIELPDIIPVLKELALSPEENRHYSQIKEKLNYIDKQNTMLPKSQTRHWLGFFQLHLQLRRICNHGTFQKLSLTPEDFDPQYAISQFQQRKNFECFSCRTAMKNVKGFQEGHDGSYTVCGHLLCQNCTPAMEMTWETKQSQGIQFNCPLCHTGISRKFILSPEEFALSMKRRNARLPLWDYFDQAGHSAKISELIHDIETNCTDRKCIVFSSWTRTLDLVGVYLQHKGLSFCRIDGTHHMSSRGKVLERFEQDESLQILLMTTGTGAFGLNLTVASCVYMMEPQWNPKVEEQAIGRVIRQGQTRNVRVVRFIMKNTVEEIEMAPQQRHKIGLARAAWVES